MKRFFLYFGLLFIGVLACGPGSTTTKDARVTITVFVDETGRGTIPESYTPIPNTLVMAKWNQHGGMFREVKLTDSNGQIEFSVTYTHFFDISVVPPCGYYSTSLLFRDVTDTGQAEFGFWPVSPADRSSMVKVMVWRDANSDGQRNPQETVVGEKAAVMFKVPGGADGNVYDQDNFIQEPMDGWFDIDLGNSCGTIYVLLLDSDLATNSVSEPGKVSDAGSHGNTFHPSIEIPYGAGETVVYWEIK